MHVHARSDTLVKNKSEYIWMKQNGAVIVSEMAFITTGAESHDHIPRLLPFLHADDNQGIR